MMKATKLSVRCEATSVREAVRLVTTTRDLLANNIGRWSVVLLRPKVVTKYTRGPLIKGEADRMLLDEQVRRTRAERELRVALGPRAKLAIQFASSAKSKQPASSDEFDLVVVSRNGAQLSARYKSPCLVL